MTWRSAAVYLKSTTEQETNYLRSIFIENMPSGTAQRPCDAVIHVKNHRGTNTDAEED